jgi:hypothetical protein
VLQVARLRHLMPAGLTALLLLLLWSPALAAHSLPPLLPPGWGSLRPQSPPAG